MRENPKKVHTTDNGFWKIHNFCFSSHLFGGESEVIKDGCFMMTLNAEQTFLPNTQLDYPEQCFGFYFLLANGCDMRETGVLRKRIYYSMQGSTRSSTFWTIFYWIQIYKAYRLS